MKSLEPRKSFGDLINAVKSCGKATIVANNDLDSAIAASFLARFFRDMDVEVEIASAHQAPRPIDLRAPLILVGLVQRTALPGANVFLLEEYVSFDSRRLLSLALQLVPRIKEVWIVSKELEAMALAAMVSLGTSSCYDERILENHMEILSSSVSSENFSVVETLRLFGYPHVDLVTALYRTLDPFILGVSLDRDGCRKLVEELGIDPTSLRGEDRDKLVSKLNEIVGRYARSFANFVGKKIVVKGLDLVDDIYELSYVMELVLELKGLEYILAVMLEPSYVNVAYALYTRARDLIRKVVGDVVEQRTNVKRIYVRGIKLSILEFDDENLLGRLPIYTIGRILRALGLCEDIFVARFGEKAFCLPLPLTDRRWPFEEGAEVVGGCLVLDSVDRVPRFVK